MKPLKIALAATAVAAAAFGTTAVAGPAQAGSFLSCAQGTTKVFEGPYVFHRFNNGELRFQACKDAAGNIDRTRVSYVKRAGGNTEVALGWQWVTRSGTPYVTEGYGG